MEYACYVLWRKKWKTCEAVRFWMSFKSWALIVLQNGSNILRIIPITRTTIIGFVKNKGQLTGKS